MIFKKTKSSKESAVCPGLLNCNNIPSFEEFTILANGNNKLVLEIIVTSPFPVTMLKSKKAAY